MDCSVLYYLGGDPRYAKLATDVMQNVVQGYQDLAPSTNLGNGGWLIPNNLLMEARATALQLPIIYDFTAQYLKDGATVYDVASGREQTFDFPGAQFVFRTFAKLIREHGHSGSNWSVLMAPALVYNSLALDDDAERADVLRYTLDTDTERQDSIKTLARAYAKDGDIWPESLQYATGVNGRLTFLMALLDRYEPSLSLFETYPNIPRSNSRASQLVFPNGEAVRVGDGHRHFSRNFFDYEMAYHHAKAHGIDELIQRYGPLISAGIQSGEYDRSKLMSYGSLGSHNQLLQLLWFADSIAESPAEQTLPRSDVLPFAGLALQRNLSTTGDPGDALMYFVAGADYVHSHAGGMNIELYGAGQVLGADSGRTSYQTTLHENYYRVWAAHNTVIVNGSSRGEGRWQDLGTDTVAVEAMEPAALQEAVSPDISFTVTAFNDDRGDRAEARQQRVLALVRTSPTSGYYVDIFRSDSSLPNEFHDYVYHNVGDTLALTTDAGSPLALNADPERYQSDIGDEYQQPGWRYFEDVRSSSSTASSIHARFTAHALPAGVTHMNLHIPGDSDREYTTVTAPPIVGSPGVYEKRRAPTLVVRRAGEAWRRPFAIVFEAQLEPRPATVQSVERIEQDGQLVGLTVRSQVDGRSITQRILSLPENGTLDLSPLGISFTGRFAVVSTNSDGETTLYLGDGSRLAYGEHSISTRSG